MERSENTENRLPDQESITDPESERQKMVSRAIELITRFESLTRVSKIIELVTIINESSERFPFPGIDPEAYSKMKKVDTEYPGLTTPTDEIIERCTREGIKIILGKHPTSGNVYVLPAESNDIGMDSFSPHQLLANNVTNPVLAELIQVTKRK